MTEADMCQRLRNMLKVDGYKVEESRLIDGRIRIVMRLDDVMHITAGRNRTEAYMMACRLVGLDPAIGLQ